MPEINNGDGPNELYQFMDKLQAFLAKESPSFLTFCNYSMGIIPGGSLDVLQVLLDFRVNRIELLNLELPPELKDPSKADLKIVNDL